MIPGSWEGNRRSGVALATCHGHLVVLHLTAQGLQEGDEHPLRSLVEQG